MMKFLNWVWGDNMSKSGYKIKSVVKAMKVLEEFKEKKELGTTDLSKKLDIPKSTMFNILYTFTELGYIQQTKYDKYKLSTKIFELSQSIEYDLRNEAKPYLRKLSEATRETINLVLHMEEKVLYTEKVESQEPININTKIGKKEDIYCTAVGKAILAFLKQDRQEKIFEKIIFHSHTPNTITDLEDLKEEIITIKNRGYAVDNEEFARGVKCVAAPIFDYKGDPISAVSITGPAERMDSKGIERLASLVKENAMDISNVLGFGS